MYTNEAELRHEAGQIKRVVTAALVGSATETLKPGQVLQLPDGRAAIVGGLKPAAVGDSYVAQTTGVFTVAKAAGITLLDGQQIFWDAASSAASYTGDFLLGVAVGDAAAADATVDVDLNEAPGPAIDLDRGTWTETLSTGTATHGAGREALLALTAVESAQHAWLTSDDTVDIDNGPILESWFKVVNKGDAAALDIDVGVCDQPGTTDWDALDVHAAFHLDGNALALSFQQDDGATDIAPDTVDVDLVEGTYVFLQIDLRDKTAPVILVNGVDVTENVATPLDMSNYSGALRAGVAIEKTSDDTPGSCAVKALAIRVGNRAA